VGPRCNGRSLLRPARGVRLVCVADGPGRGRWRYKCAPAFGLAAGPVPGCALATWCRSERRHLRLSRRRLLANHHHALEDTAARNSLIAKASSVEPATIFRIDPLDSAAFRSASIFARSSGEGFVLYCPIRASARANS
jgi:hypothetical protein